jgi:arsenite methyltransferase
MLGVAAAGCSGGRRRGGRARADCDEDQQPVEAFAADAATGIDMTPEMLAKARVAAAEMGAANVVFVESEAEQLPFANASFEVVISNGVIDLIPDKDAVFAELFRVLAPGGRIQIADVTIQNPVSAEGQRNIDLWTG